MPQTHQQPAEGPDKTSRQSGQDARKPETQKAPSLLGPKGDPAEGKRSIGPKPN